MIMIEGFLYGFLKIDFAELTNLIDNYLLKVTSWAHTDSVVANLKQLKKSPKEGFIYAKKLIHSKKPLIKRTGIIILLDYYLHDLYMWTMSPQSFLDDVGFNLYQRDDGGINYTPPSSKIGVYPSISLKNSVMLDGVGTVDNPYKIISNNT